MICFKGCMFQVCSSSHDLLQAMLFSRSVLHHVHEFDSKECSFQVVFFLSRPLVALKDAVFWVCSSFKGCSFPGLFFIMSMNLIQRMLFSGRLFFVKAISCFEGCGFLGLFFIQRMLFSRSVLHHDHDFIQKMLFSRSVLR